MKRRLPPVQLDMFNPPSFTPGSCFQLSQEEPSPRMKGLLAILCAPSNDPGRDIDAPKDEP